jgi:ABC-type Zn uptake system ZnuABC Zn-binding protein ZnuA
MDAVTVEAFLSALRSLEATKIASSGFSSPAITIAVTSQDGKLVEKVGIAKAGTEYVAKRDDSPTLYQLTPKVVTDMQEAAAVMKPAEPVPPQK